MLVHRGSWSGSARWSGRLYLARDRLLEAWAVLLAQARLVLYAALHESHAERADDRPSQHDDSLVRAVDERERRSSSRGGVRPALLDDFHRVTGQQVVLARGVGTLRALDALRVQETRNLRVTMQQESLATVQAA